MVSRGAVSLREHSGVIRRHDEPQQKQPEIARQISASSTQADSAAHRHAFNVEHVVEAIRPAALAAKCRFPALAYHDVVLILNLRARSRDVETRAIAALNLDAAAEAGLGGLPDMLSQQRYAAMLSLN